MKDVMKYQELIEKKYALIDRQPRGNQVEIINDVLTAFFDKKKKNVVLNAGTGVGKSIVGAVISECVDDLLELDVEECKKSIILMGTNGLAQQYRESFSHLDEHKYFQIRGASNYSCKFMEAQPNAESVTADDCCKGQMHDLEVAKYCGGCEFDHARKMVNKTDNLITNFTYFLTSSLASGHLIPRKLHIFDEAHTFNDAYTSYTEIAITSSVLEKYIKELSDVNGRCDDEAAGLALVKTKVDNQEIHESNYLQFLDVLKEIYRSACSTLISQSTLLKGNDLVKSMKYAKMAKKYDNAYQRIKYLIEGEYEHVFDAPSPGNVVIKTIFVSDSIDACLAEKNLFMSATITPNMVGTMIGLDETTTEFIVVDCVFPPENKPLFFIGTDALNYTSMKDSRIIDGLRDKVKKIVDFHEGEKGLLFVPSFFLGSTLVRGLSKSGLKVFEHVSGGTKLPELVKEFKDYKGAALMVSPSLWEGHDIPQSSYQIVSKAPYASLGDKRIKYIADNYPELYSEATLLKIIQSIGRSVRSPTDKANTYFLDPACKRLFFSDANLWQDHFKILSKGNK